MKKIGITDNFYYGEDGKTQYTLIKEHGFDCIDYEALCDVHGVRYTCSEAELKVMLTEEKLAAEAAGIGISQVHGPWYVDDATEELRAFNLNCMKRCVIGTYDLGCKNMVVHPVMPYHWNKEDDPAWAYALNAEYFGKVCDFAADYGVHICLENMPTANHSVGTLSQVADFVREMNRPNFDICMDTGHANITREDVFDGMRKAGDKLTVLHIHDNRGHMDEHRFPYTGTFDWDTFKKTLVEIGFGGVYSLEPCIGKQCPPAVKDQYLRTLAVAVKSLTE